jgi:palmitoyltransferase ZDHHC2/15/20
MTFAKKRIKQPLCMVQEEQQARAAVQQGRPQSAGDMPQQRANFCRKCSNWKPARAHHCSATGRCVLKLDHFCLWIVNDVGLLNQKAFLLFLFYSCAACLLAAAALLPVTIQMLMHDGASAPYAGVLLFAAIFTLAFGIALIAFLAIHWDMLARNYTSIESIDHTVAQAWPYDRGLTRNVVEVFGRRCAHLLCLCSLQLTGALVSWRERHLGFVAMP